MGTRLSQLAVLASATLVTVLGCSLLNREGPNDTCQDLAWGAINDCREGIIATCHNGAMAWKVCDSKDACEASWQTSGAYRCGESDPMPLLEAGGSGGAAGGTAGGTDQAGASGSGTAGTDCSSGCQIAAVSGSAHIDQLAVDASGVYYSDCSALYRVTASGGVPSLLYSGLSDCTSSPIVLTETNAYVQDGTFTSGYEVVEAPKTGGSSRAVLSASNWIAGFWIADDQILWQANTVETLYSTPLVGGLDTPLVTSINWIPRFAQIGTDLYVADTSSSVPVSQIDLSASRPTTAVAITTAITTADVRTDGTSLYLSDGASSISKYDPSSGTEGVLASGLTALVDYTVQGGWVWFVGRSAQGMAIMRVPSSGGAVQTVVSVGDSTTHIQVDDQAIYWSDGQKVMKRSRQ